MDLEQVTARAGQVFGPGALVRAGTDLAAPRAALEQPGAQSA